MISLYKLEIFTQVIQAGSFSRAAQGLLMTQSAVSQHIRDLEQSLGATLFERKPRGVALTPAGDKLHEYGQQILLLLAEAENAVTDVALLAQGRLTIGATPGVSVYLLPGWLQLFREKYDNLTVKIHTGTSAEILDALDSSRVDIGVIEGELSDAIKAQYGLQILDEIEQEVVVGPNHRWWETESIVIHDLDGQDFIMRQAESQTRIWLEEKLSEYGVEPVVKSEFDNLETIKRAIMMGSSLAILPPYAVEQEVATGLLHRVIIREKPLRRTLKLVWRRGVSFAPVTQAFLKQMEFIEHV